MEDSNEMECRSCGAAYPVDDLLAIGGEHGCTDCYAYCDGCGDITESEDLTSVMGEVWCGNCRCDGAFYCDGCNEYYNSNRVGYYSMRNGVYCEDCVSNHAEWCDQCDEWEENACGSSPHINHYGYKPDPIFIGEPKSGLFMGWELEADCAGIYDRDDCAEFAAPILEGIAYIKEDSSVASGIEIVTHPIAHYKVRELDVYWDTIERLRKDYDMRSWDSPQSCGLHVHLSRKGFSGVAHVHRFMRLIYGNAEMMAKFAGRTTRYATFQDVWEFDKFGVPRRNYSIKMSHKWRGGGDRNSAVNTHPEHTIELRFFKGTMAKAGILACLDLAQASVEYTRNLTSKDVMEGALSWEHFYDYVERNNGIYPDAYNRMPRVATINLDKREMIGA